MARCLNAAFSVRVRACVLPASPPQPKKLRCPAAQCLQHVEQLAAGLGLGQRQAAEGQSSEADRPQRDTQYCLAWLCSSAPRL